MDSDEFDDDIADEDLIFAASQAPNNIRSSSSITNPTPRPSGPQGRDDFDSRPTVAQSIPSRNEPVAIDLDDLPANAFSSSPDFHQTAPLNKMLASALELLGPLRHTIKQL
ncbi:ATP-dependent DNA helicase [Apiospora saccharicola]|uniref:ATP-dependent DNA helicase n=1 Tax=Apiospora saccharicola TaxID=335842 RepID=A0ABR1WFD7_9PEZI